MTLVTRGCGLLPTWFCFVCGNLVQTVYERNICAPNKVTVGVDRDLAGTVSPLLSHAQNRRPVLEEQRSKV
jgi:hypothetical protein